MNVLFSADNNYAPHLGVAIHSLLKNNEKDFDKINLYILDGGISQINKDKIKSIVDNYEIHANLEFIKYDDIDEVLGINIKATRALSTYARLFAPSLLDSEIDKILYLDCDAIIEGSLKDLWQTDIDDYYCAAVLDAGPEYINTFLNQPKSQDHFNAGMLLINLKKWREDKLEEKFLNYIVENKGKVFHNDQGVINVICKGKILKLHPKFNILSPFFEVNYENVLKWYNIDSYYDKKTVQEAIDNPVFIHLTQFVNGRPWFTNAKNHPLRELFDSYVEDTPFRNEIYTGDNRSWKGRLFSTTYKYLPFSAVCFLYRLYENLIIRA